MSEGTCLRHSCWDRGGTQTLAYVPIGAERRTEIFLCHRLDRKGLIAMGEVAVFAEGKEFLDLQAGRGALPPILVTFAVRAAEKHPSRLLVKEAK